ncbi:helix-turn-helix domain-containing protein [Spongorhabdus nitratireducens]
MNNLKKHRLSAGLTQAQVASKLGIRTNRYGSWERGEKQPPASILPQLAELFRTSTDKLLSPTTATESDRDSDVENLDIKRMFIEFDPDQLPFVRYELIIKLSIFEKPLHFTPPLNNLNLFIRNYSDSDYPWLIIQTVNNSSHIINKQHIEWFVVHDEGLDNWPSLAQNGFHETPLMKEGVSASTAIMAMAINASFCELLNIDENKLELKSMVNEDNFSYKLHKDFEWLVEHKSELFDKRNIELKDTREQLRYEEALADKEKSGWLNSFNESWGIRSYFSNGQTLFKGGCTSYEAEWHGEISEYFLYLNHGFFDQPQSYSATDSDGNEYTFRSDLFVMMELPTAFLEMANIQSHWDAMEHKPKQLSQDEAEKVMIKIIETVHKRNL